MKSKKKGIQNLIAKVIVCIIIITNMSLINVVEMKAANRTRDDAVNWAISQIGKGLDYDKVYGNQCVDLIKYYYDYFGVASYAMGNANAYISNTLPAGWNRVYGDYQPGDIAVWKVNHSCSTCNTGGYGHVGIIISADSVGFNAVNQNFSGQSHCTQNWFRVSALECAIRPNFSADQSSPQPDTSVSFADYNLNSVSENNAEVYIKIMNPNRGNVTAVGCSLYDASGNLLKSYSENCNYTTSYVNYNCNFQNDMQYTLQSGTKYKFVLYAVVNGKEYKDVEREFVTKGGYNPEGNVDSVTGNAGSVTVYGWAFDRDSLGTSLDIHVYIGGPAGSTSTECHKIIANAERKDVNTICGVGGNHGFNETIITSKIGNQPVYIYAINVGEGTTNSCLGMQTVYIAPVIKETQNPMTLAPTATIKPTPTIRPTATVKPIATIKPMTTIKPTAITEPTKQPTPTKPIKTSTPTRQPEVTEPVKTGNPIKQPEITETPKTTVPTINPIVTKEPENKITKPAKVKIKSVTSKAKKKMTVKWNWSLQPDGYQVQIALDKKFSKAKKTYNFSSVYDKATLGKLKSQKVYYVRVRACQKNNGKIVYGNWSSVKKCKVK